MEEILIQPRKDAPPISPQLLIIGGGLVLLIIGAVAFIYNSTREITEVEIIPAEVDNIGEVIVDVAGGVQNPGVYRLKSGSRFGDALTAAGGLSAQADRDWVSQTINLAQPLKDGIKIYIKDNKVINSSSQSQSQTNKININTASLEQLDQLAGIGPVTAKKIIDYRTSSGNFSDTGDLQKVPGVGVKLYEQIKDDITIY